MIRVYKLSRLKGLNKRKLTVVYVCNRTTRITAVYRLKIKYDQENFGVDLLGAKSPLSAALEDKHVVNEHHLVRKSQSATCTQKEYSHVVHFKVPRNWFKTNSRIKNCYSDRGKK